jgi:adenylate cyclase
MWQPSNTPPATVGRPWGGLGIWLGFASFLRQDDLDRGGRTLRYCFEDYALDFDRRELRRANRLVPVEPQAFDVVAYLIRKRDRVVSKDDLLGAVWHGRMVSESALTTCINAARSALGDSGREQRLIRTLPRKGFRFIGEVWEEAASPIFNKEAEGTTNGAANETYRSELVLSRPDKPSIAVLPFANLGPSQDYVSNGITEDIITQLSRFSELVVIAWNSSLQYKSKSIDVRQIGRELGIRYVLDGSVRRAGRRVRITGQLIDAVTGVHLWADSYDRDLKNIFAVQDDVARTIVGILAVQVRKAEAELVLAKPPATWKAYECYLRAAESWASFRHSYEIAEFSTTRNLLERAISIDSRYARAHALLSEVYLYAWQTPRDKDYSNPAVFDRASQLAYDALRLDPNSPFAHAQVGFVLGFQKQFDASIAEFERATTLNPNYTDWRFAFALIIAGDSPRALLAAQAYKRTDPFYPPQAALWLGAANYLLERYSEALPHLREVVTRAPGYGNGHIWCAANYAQLGLLDEARREAADAVRIDPDLTLAVATRMASVCRYQRDSEHYLDGLRKAGLPGK